MSVALDYYSDTECDAALDWAGSAAPQLLPGERVPGGWPLRVAPEVPARRLASVSVLHAPRGSAAARPLHLTRRGAVVLCALVAAVGGALLWIASLSAPAAPAATPIPTSVTVQPGDTLWSIASTYSANSDPGSMVASIERRNHLTEARLVPGEVLRLR